MKAYKGFKKDMTCRGFQFEEGKAYHEDTAVFCESGFHACLDPLDCLRYYDPCDSVYHEVEIDNVSEQREDDTKVVAKDIKIGSRISIKDIVRKASILRFQTCKRRITLIVRPGITASKPRPGIPASKPRPGISAAKPRPGIPADKPRPGIPADKPHPGIPADRPHPVITAAKKQLAKIA